MNDLAPDEGSLMLSTEKLALPQTVEGAITLLRRVLSKPYIESVILRSGSPVEVTWYRDVSDSLSVGDPEEDAESVLARVPIEEFSSSKPSVEYLFDAIMNVEQDGFHASHLFVGSMNYLKEWLGLPSVVRIPKEEGTDYYRLIGLMVLEVTSLNEDVVVLCGSNIRDATRTELNVGLKLST